ncbi:Gfo/Idh/MocA family oxidoreductase, partial [Pseudactinotalea suaedae]
MREPAPSRSTLAHVAALAGVSAKSVSRVFTDSAHVSEDTRERVLAAARRLHFRPNRLARELRSGAVSRSVGLAIADLANPFYSQIAAGCEQVLRRRGLELVIASTGEDPALERAVAENMIGRRVQALVLVPTGGDQSYLRSDTELGTVILALDRPAAHLAVDSLVADDVRGAVMLVEDLLAAGCRRIAVVADIPQAATAQTRLAACEAALVRAGVHDARWIRSGAHDAARASQLTEEMLARSERPDSVIALNNLIADGVLHALLAHGRRHPEERIAVRAFDDTAVTELLGVSVVAIDATAMGARAGARVLERLDGEDGPPVAEVLPMVFTRRQGSRARPGPPHERRRSAAGAGRPDVSTGIRWGVLGAGYVAGTFGRAARHAGITISAVGSRSPERGRAYAASHGVAVVHSSYEELVTDDRVDAVYVATPHTWHAEHALLALDAGKHVLVEKPIAVNAAEAELIHERAAARGLIALDGMWSRYLPMMRRIREIVGAGHIGALVSVIADHSQALTDDPLHRINNPDLGGGALLDLGVYPIAFVLDLLGP